MASSGNFGVNNILIKPSSTTTHSHGNTEISSTSGSWNAPLTMAAKTGKWYIEYYVNNGSSGRNIGVVTTDSLKYNEGNYNFPATGTYGINLNSNGTVYNNNESTGTQSGLTVLQTGDIMAMALNFDASPKTVQFYRNGSAVGTAENINTSATDHLAPLMFGHNASTMTLNAGQDSSFGGAKSTGSAAAADDNGFGDFYYTPPSGFNAFCTGNLPIPDDIDPAQTDDNFPQKQFNIVTYTGNSTTGQTISGLGFKPDLIWAKMSSSSQNNQLFDSSRMNSRGTPTPFGLRSDTTGAEFDDQSTGNNNPIIASFDTDGFTLGTSGSGPNDSGRTYVAWCWRANGGVTSSNTDGSITSTVQANTKAGFSICTYTGNNTNGATFGHGLSAKPSCVFIKNRDATQKWAVWHQSAGMTDYKLLFLSENSALTTEGTQRWDVSAISSSVFGLGSHPEINGSSADYVAYIWHDVEGFQKFGGYTATGQADGVFIYTGFRPRLLAIKGIDATNNWIVFDTARETANPIDQNLHWDTSDAQATEDYRDLDILSNGFKIRSDNGTLNHPSGDKYIYCAWGDVPFKYNNTF